MRTASPKPFSVISQVMVAPESLIRSIYRLRVFQNKVLGRISGTKKELVKEGWSALHNEQRGSFKSLLKHISVLKWTGGGDWWDLWQAWRSSEMSSGFTLTHSLTNSVTHLLALWPSESLGQLNYESPYFHINCLISPFLTLHHP